MNSNQTFFPLLVGGVFLSIAVVFLNFWAYPTIAPPQMSLPQDAKAYAPNHFYVEEGTFVEVDFPLNVNTAVVSQLDLIPGIGEATAQKIVDLVAQKQGLSSLEELTEISGIGQKTVEKLQEFLYCA